MPTWIVRLNCEFSTTVEAETAEEAMEIANETDCMTWGQAWSPIEAEEE